MRGLKDLIFAKGNPGGLLNSQIAPGSNYSNAELKKVLNTLFDLVEFTIESIQTGWADVGILLSVYMGYGSPKKFITVAKLAIQQFKRLDPAAAADIRTDIKANFDLTDEELEKKIEGGLEIVVEGFTLIEHNLRFVGKLKNYISDFKIQGSVLDPKTTSVA